MIILFLYYSKTNSSHDLPQKHTALILCYTNLIREPVLPHLAYLLQTEASLLSQER